MMLSLTLIFLTFLFVPLYSNLRIYASFSSLYQPLVRPTDPFFPQPGLHQHHTPLLSGCAYLPPNYASSLGRRVRGLIGRISNLQTTAHYRQPPTVNVRNHRLAASSGLVMGRVKENIDLSFVLHIGRHQRCVFFHLPSTVVDPSHFRSLSASSWTTLASATPTSQSRT